MIVRTEVKKIPPVTGDKIPHEWRETLINDKNYTPEWKKYENFHPSIQRILSTTRIPTDANQWQAERRTRITATNTASIISECGLYGRCLWKNRYQLFQTKTGQKKDSFSDDTKLAFAHGNRFEAEAANIYSQVTGIDLVEEPIGLVMHPDEDYIAATPDRLAKYFPINIEIKCPYRRRHISHSIPSYYYPQVQHQMYVLGLEETHFVQYVPPLKNGFKGLLAIVIVKFDQELWEKAKIEIKQFYQEIVDFYGEQQVSSVLMN